MWRYAIPLLAADFRVLAYDRGGFGFSSARATRWEGQERELLALLDALGEKQPIILVGFSNSSSLARVIASRQPGRVRGLVLLSPFLPEAEPSENRSYHAFRFAGKYLTKQGIGSLIGATRLGEWIGVGGRIPGQPDELWIAKRRINHIWAEFLNVVADHTSVSLAALSAAPIPMPTVLLEEPVRDPIRRAQWITAVDSLAKRVSSNLRRYQLPSEDHMTVLQNRESMLVFASALRDFVREPSVATP
jgi:pimeloyl-ACP methyl ester carboxylesterase